MGEKRDAGLMVLAFWLPLIGGLFGYSLNRKNRPDFAKVLLTGTFGLPVAFLSSFLFLKIFGFPIRVAGISIEALFLGALIVPVLIRIMDRNKYRYLLWGLFLHVFGAIYAYYRPYREESGLRKTVGWFALGTVFVPLLLFIPFLAFGVFQIFTL